MSAKLLPRKETLFHSISTQYRPSSEICHFPRAVKREVRQFGHESSLRFIRRQRSVAAEGGRLEKSLRPREVGVPRPGLVATSRAARVNSVRKAVANVAYAQPRAALPC